MLISFADIPSFSVTNWFRVLPFQFIHKQSDGIHEHEGDRPEDGFWSLCCNYICHRSMTPKVDITHRATGMLIFMKKGVHGNFSSKVNNSMLYR